MSLSSAQRKRLQRERDRLAGWSHLSMRVPTERLAEVRAFIASLPPPSPPNDPRQLDLLDRIEAELRGERDTRQDDLFQ